MNKTIHPDALTSYRRKVIQKRNRLLNSVVEMSHDDFEALLQVFDAKLNNLKEITRSTEIEQPMRA